MAQSNAGLPQLVGDEFRYGGTPEVMARYAVRMQELGVDVIGCVLWQHTGAHRRHARGAGGRPAGVGVSFFEPPEVPEEPEPYTPISPPEWIGRPRNVLGAPLAERVVLVQRDDLVIAVTSMIAFPTGVRFRLLTRSARDEFGDLMSGRRWTHGNVGPSGSLRNESLPAWCCNGGRPCRGLPAIRWDGGVAGFGYGEGGGPSRRSCSPPVAAAAAETGSRSTGCGRCHPTASWSSCASGRRWTCLKRMWRSIPPNPAAADRAITLWEEIIRRMTIPRRTSL